MAFRAATLRVLAHNQVSALSRTGFNNWALFVGCSQNKSMKKLTKKRKGYRLRQISKKIQFCKCRNCCNWRNHAHRYRNFTVTLCAIRRNRRKFLGLLERGLLERGLLVIFTLSPFHRFLEHQPFDVWRHIIQVHAPGSHSFAVPFKNFRFVA